jgi:hypothetical protein
MAESRTWQGSETLTRLPAHSVPNTREGHREGSSRREWGSEGCTEMEEQLQGFPQLSATLPSPHSALRPGTHAVMKRTKATAPPM